jgi:DNA-binding FadR family transcriptional regulator
MRDRYLNRRSPHRQQNIAHNEDVKRIEAHRDGLRQCNGPFEEISKLDTVFRVDIAKASRNSLLPLLLDPIHTLLPRVKSGVYLTVSNARESAVTWHQRMFNAIVQGNSAKAHNAMTQHLKIAK